MLTFFLIGPPSSVLIDDKNLVHHPTRTINAIITDGNLVHDTQNSIKVNSTEKYDE